MTAIEKRVNRIWEEEVDYIYYNQQTEEYFEAGISKVQMKVKLKSVDVDKALIINTLSEKKLFCSKNRKVIDSLIANIDRNRIRKFKEIDKHNRTIYQLWFHDEPDYNSYSVIDYQGCDN